MPPPRLSARLVPTKAFWKSKTLWWNAVTMLVWAAGYAVENAGLFSVPKEFIPAATAINGFGNMIIRVMFTAQPIGATSNSSRAVYPDQPYDP